MRGPPHVVLRTVAAPVRSLTTVVLFGTGAALLVRDQTDGTVVGLHKASFIVWFGAASLHVLAPSCDCAVSGACGFRVSRCE